MNISRRALFAGAAGAVVAASPAGRALALPVDPRADAFAALMKIVEAMPPPPIASIWADAARHGLSLYRVTADGKLHAIPPEDFYAH